MRTIYQVVDAVLILYDEITGRNVTRDVFEITDSFGRRAMYKENGIYIFTGKQEGTLKIRIESEYYHLVETVIDNREPGHIERIWVQPSTKNEKFSQMTVLMGQTTPKVKVNCIQETLQYPYRLLQPLKKGDTEIAIFHLPYDYLEGRKIRIKGKRVQEELKLMELSEEKNKYRLSFPAQHSYEPDYAVIDRVIQTMADETGVFIAAFRDTPSEGGSCTVEIGEDRWKKKLLHQRIQEMRCEIGEK
jgi:hypothetical protein